MRGGPSHVDTFDYKPKLVADTGKAAQGNRIRAGAKLLGSKWNFRPQREKRGSGFRNFSRRFRNTRTISASSTGCTPTSRTTPRHSSKCTPGTSNSSAHRWVPGTLYGLGTENENLPGFITINPAQRGRGIPELRERFSPRRLPGDEDRYRKRIASARDRPSALAAAKTSPPPPAIPNLKNGRLSKRLQRTQLDLIKSLNLEKLNRDQVHPEVEGVIESYELAFRMQDAVPTVMDVTSEPESVKKLYGIGEGQTDSFGRQCLLAPSLRRKPECASSRSPTGTGISTATSRPRSKTIAPRPTKPIAGLLADLKQA